MSKTALQRWLIASPGFQTRYQPLVLEAVAHEFPALSREFEDVPHDWPYLLKCASVLAQSDEGDCQEAALRIAQYCLTDQELEAELHAAAAVILDSLSNSPALRLAESRALLKAGVQERLPLGLRVDWIRREFSQSIAMSNSSLLRVNRFQREFWNSVSEHQWISVSAPTSAGKSFIVKHWITEFLRTRFPVTVVYLVPTRALVAHVQADIEQLFVAESIGNASISSIPLRSHLKDGVSNVLVLTQERLHILLANGGLSVDLLIVDEAQKIGDDYRGVLLQQAIESVVASSGCQVIFASPMSENPELLLEDASGATSSDTLIRDDRTVNQNLIWASQVPGQPLLWDVELILGESNHQLGRVTLPARPTPASKRMPFLAYTLGARQGGNVVYVNGAAEAEKVAKQLFDLVGNEVDLGADPEIVNLIDLTRRIVHRRYSLAEVLRRGIAFHYGNMPLVLRSEIERLFCENKISFLVCTSTLVEGVNLPCRSIFLRGPRKGRGRPMSDIDFWNLAGRAGRWGQEFQGNVICVDPKVSSAWEKEPPRSRGKFQVRRTVDEVVRKSEALISYIEQGTPRATAASSPNLEYTSAYLFGLVLSGKPIIGSRLSRLLGEKEVLRLDEVLRARLEKLQTPASVILRNPGISPIAMDEFLAYLRRRRDDQKKRIQDLVPVPPESNDAVSVYASILGRINEHLASEFGRGRRIGQLALLAVNWMNGQPLARLISNREKRYGSENLPDLIRQTMKDVEEFARFKIPRYLSCYTDLVRIHLQEESREDLVARLFDASVLLEFGAAQPTQLSLMSLGLSRSSSVALSEYISSDSLGEDEVLRWLRENEWMTEDLPELVKREVALVFERASSVRQTLNSEA